jgi:hypothetical protein
MRDVHRDDRSVLGVQVCVFKSILPFREPTGPVSTSILQGRRLRIRNTEIKHI